MNLPYSRLAAFLIFAGSVTAASGVETPGVHAAITGATMSPVTRQPAPPPAPIFKVRDFGAKGDGVTDDTAAIRKAIHACAGTGGSVLVEGGTFISGYLELKGNMTLHIAEGATLKASDKPADFPVITPKIISGTAAWGTCKRSFLYADGADKLRIDGLGTIDGNAVVLRKKGMGGDEYNRPSILRVFASKDVTVRNITLKNSLMWTQVYDGCENLVVENQIVRCPPVHANHDGMDICNCRHVIIRNNDLDTEDDVICLKSHGPAGMSDVLIENNTLRCVGANAIKFGTSSVGDIKGVRILNNTVNHAKLGGLCLESVDGSNVSDILVQGLTLNDCAQPVFIRLSLRGSYKKEIDQSIYPKAVGSITGVRIENVVITPSVGRIEPSCTVTGITRKNLGEISFKDIRVVMRGGVDKAVADPKENDSAYPQSSMFGRIPAHAFFVRHADKVSFENIEVGTARPDARPWLRSVDAKVETKNIRELGVVK